MHEPAGPATEWKEKRAISVYGKLGAEIEFRDNEGRGSGKRIYLQLKAGDSHLRRRERDEKEIFQVKKEWWGKTWQSQPGDVYLVIRTSDAVIRWMNVTECLRKQGKKTVKQIVFEGEPFTVLNLLRVRDNLVGPPG